MEVQLTAELESRLLALAARDGRLPADLAREAIARYLDEEARFAEAVALGIAAADRGEWVPAEAVWEGVEQILRP